MKVQDLLALLKLPLKFLISIFLVLAIVLFGPQEYMVKIGISDLVATYRTYIGLAFLCSILFILTYVFDYILKGLRALYMYKMLIKQGKRKLKSLTNSEKEILKKFIEKGTKSTYLQINNGNVAALSQSEIIYRSCELPRSDCDCNFNCDCDFAYAYNLNEWAWEYLNKNKWLLA